MVNGVRIPFFYFLDRPIQREARVLSGVWEN
jgi:hypothetical protein